MKKEKMQKRNRGKGVRLLLGAAGVLAAAAVLCGIAVLVVNICMVKKYESRILTAGEAGTAEADCILVLGAGVRDDGSPSLMLSDRLETGITLYQAGVSDRLLMSGDHGRIGYDEVNTMKNFAIEEGVPEEAVFMDHAGFSTYESMYRAKEIFQVKKAVIVTQKYHLYRALYLANELGIEAWGVPADLRSYRGQAYFSLREVAARVKDFLILMYRPEPTYLGGETIPISGSGTQTNDGKTLTLE